MDRYFNDVYSSEPLSASEEHEIALRAAAGDKEAIDVLVKANLRFVISVAKQYSYDGDHLAEMISQGNVGLIEAAHKFDPTRGFKFISFAVWYVRKEILAYLNRYTRIVRIPQNIILDINRIKKVESRLSAKLGREPFADEIVDEMTKNEWRIDPDKLPFVLECASGGTTPLESSNPDEEWAPISWLAVDDTASHVLEMSDQREVVQKMLAKLSPFERELVTLRLGLNNNDPLSFIALGQFYGKSSEWARQKYETAIRRLKHLINRKKEKQ